MTDAATVSHTDSVEAAVCELAARDERLSRARRICGPLRVRKRKPGFEALIRLVVEQQLSLASAAAIMGRVRKAVSPFTAENLLSVGEADLRAAGLSRRKIAYCTGIAAACISGELDVDGLAEMPDDGVVRRLSQLHGIGRWTAEIYLITSLGRQDVLPAGDLALQVAARDLFDLPERPSARELDRIGEAWRPYRSVAARMLWQYYRAVKGREAVS